MQDTLETFDYLTIAIYRAVPWLVAGTIMQTHPTPPYQGPKPYAVINSPRNTRSHTQSFAVGNRPGTPNRYTVNYYETTFVGNGTLPMEEQRVYQTYDAIGIALVTLGGEDADLPGDLAIAAVELETSDRGPWILGPGNLLYIGGLIHIDIYQQYSG